MSGGGTRHGAGLHFPRSLLLALAGGWAAVASAREAVAPLPVAPPAPSSALLYLAGAGRFEVVAEPGEEGRALARTAEAAWSVWREPLGLPDHLPVAVTVRLIQPERWEGAGPGRRVSVDPGGVVTVWIRAGGEENVARERFWLTALAEGALRRRAIMLGAAPEAATPAWLAAGAAEDALTQSLPSMLDAWRQSMARAAVIPTLREVLTWNGSGDEAADAPLRMAAYGVWQWLQLESGRSPAWGGMVAGVLRGKPPGLALVEAYPARFARASAAELELGWSVAGAGLARMRAVPLLEAEESRRWLEQTDRVVLRLAGEERERVASLADMWAGRTDPFITAQRDIRLTRLTQSMARVHPFYRNAAGSLGRALIAQSEGKRRAWEAALEEWRDDLALGRELEQASAALLDSAER